MLEKIFRSSTSQDVSREAIAEMRETIDRYARIFRGSRGYGFVDWDLETGRVEWHGGFWAHLGYDEKAIEQIPDSQQFVQFVAPDDRQFLADNLLKLVKNENPEDFIFRVIRKDGGIVWVEMRIDAVRGEGGWATHVSGVVFDVSALKETEGALKESEARHARIIQGSNDGIWEWSASTDGYRVLKTEDGEWEWSQQEGGVTFSARCWEMLGYAKDDEAAKGNLLTWRRLIHKDDIKIFNKNLTDHIAYGSPFDVEYRIRGKEGDWRWIRCRGSMSYNADGKPTTLSGTITDVTALKRAEQRAMRAKEEAEKASQAKSEFLSSMSHELRTPLNAILGFAQLLEYDARVLPEHRESVKEIKAAGEHLLELVNDVLDLAKIEAGRLKLSLEEVLPSRVVQECAALMSAQCEQSDITLQLKFHDLENQIVIADVVRLKQVVLNLMGNAVKYNRKGGRVTVSFSRTPDNDLRISIDDTGRGIPKPLQSQLFQPFNRLGAETSDIEGTGVGLVITKQLIEQMRGQVDFVSEDGVGSRFWVELPCSNRRTHMATRPTTHIAHSEVLPELTVPAGCRVLYIEDNPLNQNVMSQVFARWSHLTLDIEGLALQGLYRARAEKPDLVILDINMAGVSGYEIVDILKSSESTASIPVIALSANALAHEIEKGHAAGFDAYLTKPLNIRELVLALNTHLV